MRFFLKTLQLCILYFVLIISSWACKSNNWIYLFDGSSMDGWTAVENQDTWRIEDGMLITEGPRSHLFYTGEVNGAIFKNFVFNADVKTEAHSNSGIYVHTELQESGWPAKGYECQVLNSHPPAKPGAYMERKLTGSIYGIRDVWKSPARDREWFNYRIVVLGKTIQTFINNVLISEYTESDDPAVKEIVKGRRLGQGTFALQGHDPGSKVCYKNIKVKPLLDDLPTPGKPMDDGAFDAKLISISQRNVPLMDLHMHLKGGLTIDQAMTNARRYGFTYGFAVNCGLKMGIESNDSLEAYFANYKKPAGTYLAMQAEGREWLDLFKPETIAKFDYVFTDAMTWTNKNGKRMRLWINEETEVGDPQDFMNQLVANIEKILTEPVDIYVNPTYLPDEIADRYDELWTKKRMDRVIAALVKNNVALEINNRRKIPSPNFIKRAKKAGVRFTFGTNNGRADDLGRMDYGIEMISECGLNPSDMWYPELKK